MYMLAICAATLMINLSSEPWNSLDMKSKKRASYVCKKQYKSCLKKFVKKEKRVYNAICGD